MFAWISFSQPCAQGYRSTNVLSEWNENVTGKRTKDKIHFAVLIKTTQIKNSRLSLYFLFEPTTTFFSGRCREERWKRINRCFLAAWQTQVCILTQVNLQITKSSSFCSCRIPRAPQGLRCQALFCRLRQSAYFRHAQAYPTLISAALLSDLLSLYHCELDNIKKLWFQKCNGWRERSFYHEPGVVRRLRRERPLIGLSSTVERNLWSEKGRN